MRAVSSHWARVPARRGRQRLRPRERERLHRHLVPRKGARPAHGVRCGRATSVTECTARGSLAPRLQDKIKTSSLPRPREPSPNWTSWRSWASPHRGRWSRCPSCRRPARVDVTTIVLGLTTADPVEGQAPEQYRLRREGVPASRPLDLHQHGRFETVFGPMAPALCLAPSDEYPAESLPSSTCRPPWRRRSSSGEPPRICRPRPGSTCCRGSLPGMTCVGPRAFTRGRPGSRRLRSSSSLRSVSARRCDLRPMSPSCTAEETFRSLVETEQPALLVEDEDDFLKLQESWGLEDGAGFLSRSWSSRRPANPRGSSTSSRSSACISTSDQHAVQLQTCDTLDLVTATRDGMKSRPVTHAFEEGRVLVTATQPEQVLSAVSAVLQLDLTPRRHPVDHRQRSRAEDREADRRAAQCALGRGPARACSSARRSSGDPSRLRPSRQSRTSRAGP